MKKLLIVAGVLLAGAANAQSVPNFLDYATDRNAHATDFISVSGYTNQISIDSASTGYNTSCPTGTKFILMNPSTNGAMYRGKPNGTGLPPTGTVIDGTAWQTNPVGRTPTSVNGSVFTHMRIQSDTVGTVIPYDCYK